MFRMPRDKFEGHAEDSPIFRGTIHNVPKPRFVFDLERLAPDSRVEKLASLLCSHRLT
jgi:hypothetical protein